MPELTPYQQLGQSLIERAKALGFACAGIASLEPIERAQHLDAWLDAGMHGEMGYLDQHRELKSNPGQIIAGASCALVVGDLYATRDENLDEPTQPGTGRIARYARGRDYHKLIKKRLVRLLLELQEAHPGAEFKAFVDTAPLPERELAARAGIGWVGKHTLVIHPKHGSYLFLGGIVMTLKAENPPEVRPVTDHCGTCTRCIDACPTDAITPHRVDARRCISYLTIEHRSPIEPELAIKVGDWVYGCDICQEVCPHNSPKPEQLIDEPANPAYRSDRTGFDVLEVLGWSEDDRREAFVGSAMKRAKLEMMQRNAAIVVGNQFPHMDRNMQRQAVARLKGLQGDAQAGSLARDAARDALLAIDDPDGSNHEHDAHAGGEPD
ncbi:MAG: tRNA epoxyqueuosine(34) reductase QueG [Phycisphaerales bacterium JB047]